MEIVFQAVTPLMPIVSAAAAFYMTKWLQESCLHRRWGFAVPLVVGAAGASLYAAYFTGHEGPWSLSFGITVLRPEFRLYAGAVAELMVIIIGAVFAARILGYCFRRDLFLLMRRRGARNKRASSVFHVLQFFVIIWVALYHFHPDFGTVLVIKEGAKTIKDSVPADAWKSAYSLGENLPETNENKEDASAPNGARAKNAPVGLSLNYTANAHLQSALFAGPPQLLEGYLAAETLDGCREAFVKHFSAAYITDRDRQFYSADAWPRYALIGELRQLFEQEQQGMHDANTEALVGVRSAREVLLSEFFDELVYAKCVTPYAMYSLYSAIAFSVLFLSIVFVPLHALPRYQGELQSAIQGIRDSRSSGGQGSVRTEQAFLSFWSSAKDIVAKYTEILALIAFFLMFEIIVGFDTLSAFASQITFAAALLVVASGVCGFGSAVLVESAIKAANARSNEMTKNGEREIPAWLRDKNIKVFAQEVRNETTVGAMIGFIGFSVLVGVIARAALYLGWN